MLEKTFQYIYKIFFWIFKIGGRWFFWMFSDFEFWSVAPPGCVKKDFFLLKLLIDQPPTELLFTIFLIEATSRLYDGSYLQAETSMIWRFFLNHTPQECLRPKILNYGPIGISWSGSLGWAIKLIIHRILLLKRLKITTLKVLRRRS